MKKPVIPCSIKFKNQILSCRKHFKTRNWHSSESLLLEMVLECEKDDKYYECFIVWATGKQSTLYLRDILFPRFEKSLSKMYPNALIDNAWTGLDAVQELFSNRNKA